ncbi:MAG TPA: hypothetical protein VIK35_01635 [Verrucomicrobiae bacterium]
MKLPYTIYGSRFTIWKKSSKSAVVCHRACDASRQPSIVNHKSQNGIALIITLILLAVTLVMALAFLAISRRESSSVTTAGETATARLAADAALANAEAEAMAGILSTTNPYDFGLLVSTNYINPAGFNPAAGANPTNVNYDYLASGGALNQAQQLQNLENLFYSPRPPVFIQTNANPKDPLDSRFYLDLNRNGHFDPNGIVADVDNTGATNGNFSFETGDPEWIGVLEHPDQPYGPNNPFIARYAFFALPVGNTLDLNYIHNQALIPTLRYSGNPIRTEADAYFRNQGVGSWEINLAAFLADLNTNEWDNNTAPYLYNPPPSGTGSSGLAVEDARALLASRYNDNYNTLAWVQTLFGSTGATAFRNDGIDGYSDGPLQTTFDTNEDFVFSSAKDIPTLPWAGADNTNHFFTPSDLFDPTKSSGGTTGGFTNRLLNAGAQTDTYDRYTYYRLLSQLGTDSSPESGRMNLNYDNLDGYGNVIPGAETNFIPWTNSVKFFTSAADRMLREYTANWINQNYGSFTNTFGVSTTNAFGVGNIPVYVNGQFVYSPAINRILQLAANIYDATESNRKNGSPDYPDVFRPLFGKDLAGDVFIAGYTNLNNNGVPNTVSGPGDLQLSRPFDVETISAISGTSVASDINIYGVPWIIGAKKGFPNFNEISAENSLAVTRRLQLTRTTNSSTPVITGTNQMYTMSLNSSIGVELWNSYASNYPGTIQIAVNENASTMITNDDQGLHKWTLQPFSTNALYSINPWPGSGVGWRSSGSPNAASFIPIFFTGPTLTNSVYYSSHYTGGANLLSTNSLPSPVSWESTSTDGNGFYFPQFGVLLTNRLQVFMLAQDSSGYHVIDYVHFEGPDSAFNLNAALQLQYDGADANGPGVWNTNYPSGSAPLPGVTYGILHQISISKNGANSVPVEDGQWQPDPEAVPLGGTIAQQAAYFYAFFQPGNHYGNVTNLQTTIQAPYSPTRYISQYATWQANDPLVHYLASDIDELPLNNSTTPQPGLHAYSFPVTNALPNLGQLNDRYMPWGGNSKQAAEGQTQQFDPNAYNSAERDPLASSSDNWDFPTNKLPTTGWLGRVHRGTPWQTVYLKSSPIDAATWATWTGDTQTSFNQYFDAANSAPAQDRLLFDLFTTAFNDNATRGQLSVNVAANDRDPAAGLAAWSALFSGVVVPPSGPTNTYSVIQPAGIYSATNPPPLVQIVAGINQTRTNTALFPRQSFAHAGDILAVPQLTEQSPFLNLVNTNYNGDERYEWLPQQVMSLLRVGTPRYVIYSYGQTLKPAPNGTYLGAGSYFGMVTNYQIVAETATRAVVRIDSTVTNILGTLSVTNNRAVIERYNILPPD